MAERARKRTRDRALKKLQEEKKQKELQYNFIIIFYVTKWRTLYTIPNSLNFYS